MLRCFIFLLIILDVKCFFKWDRWNEDMAILANYLTPFKYLTKDQRFSKSPHLQRRNFFKKFPVPPLKVLNSVIVDKCDKGLLSCVEEVKSKALQSWSLQSTWYGKNGRTTPLGPLDPRCHPFQTALEEFQYKTTALYYLCWFTMMRSSKLRHVMIGKNCLETIKDSNDVLDFVGDEDYFKIEDVRTDKKPFQCAEIFFCPEPCYDLKNHGLAHKGYNRKTDIENPCYDLKKNDECEWLPEANTNMNDLMKNKLNYTCKCEENFEKGFKWSVDYKICLDVDECFDRIATCPKDQVCQNTKGGYLCHCKRGYKYNMDTDSCEEHFVLPKAKFVSRRKKPKPAGMTFTKQLEILIGLEDSAHAVTCHLYLIICTVILSFQSFL